MVWIIIGSCIGVLVVLIMIIVAVCYCKKQKEQSTQKTPDKTEISYPNSLVEGHGVNLSRANTLRSQNIVHQSQQQQLVDLMLTYYIFNMFSDHC